jgi:hypothetical protein
MYFWHSFISLPDDFDSDGQCFVMDQKSGFGKYNPLEEYINHQHQQQNRSPPASARVPHADDLDLSPNTLSQLEPTPIADRGVQVVDQFLLSPSLATSALGVVATRQQRDLHDWIRLLRESNESKPAPAPTSSSATASSTLSPQNPFSSRKFQQTSTAMPSHQSSILQQGVMDDTLDLRKAESARLNQKLSASASSNVQELQIRPHHNEKWNERYLELCEFHRRFGHSVVPYHYKESSALVSEPGLFPGLYHIRIPS